MIHTSGRYGYKALFQRVFIILKLSGFSLDVIRCPSFIPPNGADKDLVLETGNGLCFHLPEVCLCLHF